MKRSATRLVFVALAAAAVVGLVLSLRPPAPPKPVERLAAPSVSTAAERPGWAASAAAVEPSSAIRPASESGLVVSPSAGLAAPAAAGPFRTAPPVVNDDAGSKSRTSAHDLCLLDSNCPARHGCLLNPDTRFRECLPSECEADAHCFPGFSCRVLNDGTSGPPVRRCIPAGARGRGEPCSVFEPTRETSCRDGLVCLFFVCGVRCEPGADSGCSTDESCVPSQQGEGATCLTSCLKTGCADGLSCVKLGAMSKCSKTHGTDCTRTPCAAGKTCDVDSQEDLVRFECRTACSSVTASGCPAGEVCGAGVGGASYCYPACEPKQSGCAEPTRCRPVNEDGTLFGCR